MKRYLCVLALAAALGTVGCIEEGPIETDSTGSATVAGVPPQAAMPQSAVSATSGQAKSASYRMTFSLGGGPPRLSNSKYVLNPAPKR